MEPISVIPAILAAPAGAMASSLRTFLNTLPEIQILAQACDYAGLAALAAQLDARLVLLDSSLPGSGLYQALLELHGLAQPPRVVALVNSPAQQTAALAAGASCALMKGFLDDQLRRAVLEAALPYPDDFTHAEHHG